MIPAGIGTVSQAANVSASTCAAEAGGAGDLMLIRLRFIGGESSWPTAAACSFFVGDKSWNCPVGVNGIGVIGATMLARTGDIGDNSAGVLLQTEVALRGAMPLLAWVLLFSAKTSGDEVGDVDMPLQAKRRWFGISCLRCC